MKTFGVGRFVKDPVLKDVANTKVCEFSLAVNEYRKINGERKKFAHFFDFVAWDKAAELIAGKSKKGDQLFFEASARQDRWEDKETGKLKSRVIFRLNDFTFLTYDKNDGQENVNEDDDVQF